MEGVAEVDWQLKGKLIVGRDVVDTCGYGLIVACGYRPGLWLGKE